MRGIKHVLTERQYAWEDAVKLAENDPEINLSGAGPAFTPSEYLEEYEEPVAEAAEAGDGAAKETVADGEQSLKSSEAAGLATPPTAEPKAQSEAPRL
jgi:large subunit ribosomal protein L47